MIDDRLLEYTNEKWLSNGVPFSGSSTENGNFFHYKNGHLHNERGPAAEYASGSKSWYKSGKLHREDGPALVWENGYKYWFIHGERHREDGPAIERADGTKEWFIHNKRIRTWKEYHKLSTLSPQEQMIVKFRYGEQLE